MKRSILIGSVYCATRGLVRRADISPRGHNNDGIDPEATRNLLVEACRFDRGDDAIAIKSGTNYDGWRLLYLQLTSASPRSTRAGG